MSHAVSYVGALLRIQFSMAGVLFFKDFKFVPLMFVTLGLRSQIPLVRAIFRGLGTQIPGVQTLRVQRKTS